MPGRSNEPLWWAPFSAGMMVDALCIPALVLITGFLIPLEFVGESVRNLLLHPLTRAVLFVIVSLSFFHAAHRTRYVMADLGLKFAAPVLAVLCYAAAIVGTAWAGAVALGRM